MTTEPQSDPRMGESILGPRMDDATRAYLRREKVRDALDDHLGASPERPDAYETIDWLNAHPAEAAVLLPNVVAAVRAETLRKAAEEVWSHRNLIPQARFYNGIAHAEITLRRMAAESEAGR